MKILVAEDNQINQKLFAKLFQALGYKPDIVSDGAEAVKAVCEGDYDIVMMDIQMPEMDGLEATKRIRAFLKTDYPPIIIAITANAISDGNTAFVQEGMNDFLPKPFMIKDLKEKLEYWQQFLQQHKTLEASLSFK